MADIAKSGTPSLSTLQPMPGSGKLPTLTAGEDIVAGDACYIKSDGLVWRSNGTAVNAAAKVDGYAPMGCKAGDAITLLFNVTFRYGAALTPGSRVFLSAATSGGIADAASTGGTAPVGFVVDATRIYLQQSRY
jgi:hypothetical protein